MSVSVLIPAYRPRFLRQAIGSVLAQGYEDYELLICDDSSGEAVQAVLAEFRDPRLHTLRTNGNTGGLENMRLLWDAASRPLIKYLFDDDLLMPNALVEMTSALDAHPDASFCFSNRYIIDEAGRVTDEVKRTPDGRIATVLGDLLADAMLGQVRNIVGEFSNVLVNRAAGIEFTDVHRFHGFGIEMLGDVTFYLNAGQRGPAVQIGKTLAAFRRHAEQHSSPAYNPRFAKSLCEWELLIRCAYDAGRLSRESTLAGVRRLEGAYGGWLAQCPELALLQPELAAFRQALEAGAGQGVTQGFCAAFDALTDRTDARWRERREAAAAS